MTEKILKFRTRVYVAMLVVRQVIQNLMDGRWGDDGRSRN